MFSSAAHRGLSARRPPASWAATYLPHPRIGLSAQFQKSIHCAASARTMNVMYSLSARSGGLPARSCPFSPFKKFGTFSAR